MNKIPITLKNYLLPYRLKYIGLFVLFIGIALAIIRFYYNIKPAFFDLKVFAIYSQYLETKYFSIVTNHFLEEIAGILILIGLVLVAFSQEKEENDNLLPLRFQAFVLSLYINSIFLILSLLFVFGIGFIGVLIINMFLVLVLYIIIFRYKIISNKHQ